MWLKDKNGSIYRIDTITSVTPLEMRSDKRNQALVTEVLASITMMGGHTRGTELSFDDVVRQVVAATAPTPASINPVSV
jgi:hypothetical protein